MEKYINSNWKSVNLFKTFLDKTKDNKDTYDNYLNNIKKLMKYKDSNDDDKHSICIFITSSNPFFSSNWLRGSEENELILTQFCSSLKNTKFY